MRIFLRHSVPGVKDTCNLRTPYPWWHFQCEFHSSNVQKVVSEASSAYQGKSLYGKCCDDFQLVPPRQRFQFSLYVLEEPWGGFPPWMRDEFMEGTKRMFLWWSRIIYIVDSTIVKRFEFLRWDSIIIATFTDSFATFDTKNCINSKMQLDCRINLPLWNRRDNIIIII